MTTLHLTRFNILISERSDLLLLFFIVGEGLLVLLPVLAGGGRL